MFEIESHSQDEIIISTKQTTVRLDLSESVVDAKLAVGKIEGPGEFEIGDVSIRGILAKNEKTIYDVEVGGLHIGVIGDIEDGLDDLGMSDILCTSSVRAVREIAPKMVISMGNLDGMVSELKITARAEKKIKIKNSDSLPTTLEVVALS